MTLGPTVLYCPDFGKIIADGYEKTLEDVKKAQKLIRYNTSDDVEKADLFESAVLIIEAMLRLVDRYSSLAVDMAAKELNSKRKSELMQISEICKNVPRKGAKNFREAIQAFYFYWIYTAGGATPGGRFDQYMYPYYKADLEAGLITREEALELIECLRIKIMSFNTVFGGKQEAFNSIFMEGAIEVGKEGQSRTTKFENSSCCNMVGNTTVIDSLAAVKKLVFDNWVGYDDIQKLCQNVPKYGNDDDFVDSIAVRFWGDYVRIVKSFKNIFGKPLIPTATSITAHAPGGAMTSATPDGRVDGETLADGSTSPFQGADKNGPMAVLRSAMKLNQDPFQATLMNMKFHASALKTDNDLDKLGALIKTYLTNGGKHVQFNVADKETLIAAKKDKEKYSDLIVRVAGYSSYFTVLTPKVQDEIIDRTAHRL